MTFDHFLPHLFVLVDDLYRDLVRSPLRRRGPRSTALSDSEFLAIELAGEFLGLDSDKGLFAHLRRYHAAGFPALARVLRTTFGRQAATLSAVKKQLHAHLAERERVFLIDACAFGRAKFASASAGRRPTATTTPAATPCTASA